jgi:putative protein-disulfide isomerase
VVEFGAELDITYVMGGLAREFEDPAALALSWLEHSAESGMPVDPRIWANGAPRSSYPACIAVLAALEQGADAGARYLRVLREGFMCRRRKLDGPEALVEEARGAGLDAERFRIDLESNATLEAFARDLEETRSISLPLPALRLIGADGGEDRWVGAGDGWEAWRAAAIAAGASPSGEAYPDVPGALERFGRMATAELQAVCDLPGPRAGAEAWRLAGEWRVKRLPVLAGELWELA